MDDFDPYVAAPSEAPPRDGRASWRPWLAVGVVTLLLLALLAIRLVDARQDPSLQLPSDLVPGQPAQPDDAIPDPLGS